MDKLREKAYQLLRETQNQLPDLSKVELEKLVEELQIHQIELQVQNLELRESRLNIESSRRKYFNLFDFAPVGHLVVDDKGIIIEVNLKAAETFGRRKDRVLNRPFVSLLEAEYISTFYQYFDDIKNKRAEKPAELLFHKEKEIRIAEVSIVAHLNNYLLSIIDITEKRQTEQALFESELLHRTILTNISDAVFITDWQGAFTYICPNSEQIFGYDKDEIIAKKSITNILGHDLFDPKQLNNKTELVNIEKNITDKQGKIHHLIVNIKKVAIGKGELLYTCRDISERKDSAQKIDTLSTRIQASMMAGNMAWWEMEMPSGKVIFNENKAKMLGREPADFIYYTDFTNILHPDSYSVTMEAFKKHIEGLTPVYECEYRIQTADGSYRWFHDIGKIVEKHTDSSKIAGIVTDITEKVEREQKMREYSKQMEELNATKDKFFSIIAHDLKNPFNTILGFSELLLQGIGKYEMERIKKFANAVYNSAQSAYKLLANLLEWAQSQTGKIDFEPQQFDLYTIIEESLTVLKNTAVAKNITILNHLSPQTFIIYADSNMLRTIFRNLISNAIKFTSHDGKVHINAQMTIHEVIISVSDTGIGMSNQILDKLFKITEKISLKGTDDETGTGLGLILCKEFVDKHGGKIWAESIEGEGSIFSFTIPNIKL